MVFRLNTLFPTNFSLIAILGEDLLLLITQPLFRNMLHMMKLTGIAFSLFLLASSVASAQSLTGPQKNAVRSAENYLSFAGFSRNGLIRQLSSSAGDGYSVADATAAVDSMTVDWNAQAAKSAELYLSFSGFSCSGLIQQLTSSAGDQYSQSQATFGAQQAGAC